MTEFHYRYSIIPGGAITDSRLEARDFQVLALLGRHTKRGGWCWRSQVKMARELKCGRATIQRSLDRLTSSGWVECKIRGRGAAPANAEKQPFAPHWYRVKLDNDVPDEVLDKLPDDDGSDSDHESQDDGCPPMGTSTDGHAGAHPGGHGGAHSSGHPNEGTLSEGNLVEPERESRAREDKRPSIKRFLLKWPTAGVDNQAHMRRAWGSLSDDECDAALAGIEVFLAELKKHKRSSTPAGWNYLEEKSWTLINNPTATTATHATFDCWSREWWADLLERIERKAPVGFMVQLASEPGKKTWSEPISAMPSADRIAEFKNYPSDGDVMAKWRPWFESHGVKLPRWEKQCWVFLPSPDPPGSTGPPPTHELSEEDSKALEYK